MKAADAGQPADVTDAGIHSQAARALVGLAWRSYAMAAIVEPPIALGFLWFVRADVDGPSLVLWASSATFLLSSRALLAWGWIRSSKGAWDHLRWARILHAHSLASAFLWGSASVMFLPQLEPLHQAFLIAIVCGISGGAMAELSSYRPALWTNVPAILGPLSLTLLFLKDGEIYEVMGVLAVIYAAYLLNVGRNHEQAMRTSHLLRFERKAMVQRLEQARQTAERTSKSKDSFLANMSHELRTPLNAIIGFSELIETRALGEQSLETYTGYAKDIRESGLHLLMLVNEILDLAKAEAGDLTLSEEEVDLASLGSACLTMVAPVALKAGINLLPLEADVAMPMVLGDQLRLRQIILNLLSNAIKFTPKGGRVTIKVEAGEKGGIDVCVADTGVGMSPEQVEAAMKPFVQLDHGYDKKFEGSGLGLPITKVLAESHGGTIKIRSAPGAGTTAVFSLPAARVVSHTKAAGPDVSAFFHPAMNLHHSTCDRA